MRDQIKILEKYKASEYTERWAYELARLYARAGMYDKCIAECDEMVLWFSDGKVCKESSGAENEVYGADGCRERTI